MKRITVAILSILLCVAAPQSARAAAPVIHGRAALLLDGVTGQVLYEYNGAQRNFPASTTKLLTALVAVEHGELQKSIKVSARAIDQAPDSSSCSLNQGEEQPLENLLYGLLLASGNDCAVAISEGITDGKPEQFIQWMNDTAERLGATHSHFTNPHGLHDPNHYTTAMDLALIAQAALSNSTLKRIAGTREFNWPGKNNGTYYNHNAMLFTYDGTVGGKTGFTEEAQLTLVNAAARDGRFLIGVVMGEESKTSQYNDMAALLSYGFENFEVRDILLAGSPQGILPVENGRALSSEIVAQKGFEVAVARGGEPKAVLIRHLAEKLTAPVAAGDVAGSVEVREGDRLLGSVPLVTKGAVEAKPDVAGTARRWAITVIKWIGALVLGLYLFRLVVKTTRRLIRRARRSHKRIASVRVRARDPLSSARTGDTPNQS